MVLDTLEPDIWNRGNPPFLEGMPHGGFANTLRRVIILKPLHGPVCGEQLIGMDSGHLKPIPRATFWETTRHLREMTVY
jgi:hypothetical protein